MSNRETLVIILMSAFLGFKLADEAGRSTLFVVLGLGWAVVVILTVLAYRRGERVFIWQKQDG
ncbi:hypothetical protein D1610_16105 [Sphingomonas gilva]|uniref:Uncharacterized protein n=1 Tax=Sphingomonas gilva TaxID=2305907 RepID=A0A396RK18_9SPHN|nr:hypothetical protein [Sphingomonas gilva]RHW16359.1 hypothetical protein D1610_16105 [Sphingomonas gilva]